MNSILNCPMQKNRAGAATVGEYLIELLRKLWKEGSDFSPKRPFGNSSWEYEIYRELINEGVVEGKFDEDGYIESVDEKTADKLIDEAILSLWKN
jgi:hypothetical protein